MPFMFACNGTNRDNINDKGKAFDAGLSPAMNAYEFEHNGYKYVLFSGITNEAGGNRLFNGVVLDPAYEQGPKFKVKYVMEIDTLQDLSIPIPINLND